MSRNTARKTILVAVLGLLVALFFTLDLGDYLSFSYIKQQQSAFLDYYRLNSFFTVLLYFSVYVIVAAMSLPGAAIMTLLGGAMFGVVNGSIIVSFASTLGATLAMLVSRFLLRDLIQNRFADKLRAINEGMDRDGDFYLFTLRLIPLFPFFVVNLVMGLTRMKIRRYFIVSQIGMLPGTVVYVNAGSQLASIDSAAGILSPGLLLGFALLGLFPLIAKKSVDFIKARKALRAYPRPKRFDYNMIVIGAGSAGLVSAYIGSAVKARVALIEKHKMGGDCLNTGCVPSKALIRSAKILSYTARAKEFGFRKAEVTFDFAEVMQRVQRVIEKIEPHDSVERYQQLGVDVIQGEARIVSPYEVEVDGRTLTSRNIVIATGARPLVPTIEGIDGIDYLTSDSIWSLRQQPRRLLVLGGGPIGCELAQAFQRLGSQVTLVQRGERILPREDEEVSELVRARFEREGMQILTGHEATRFENENGQHYLLCRQDEQDIRVEFDQVLLALGRRANVSGFGLEDLNIRLRNNGTVEADEFLRTQYPNIFVCGDVTGPYQFTHTASHQAWYVAVNGLFDPLKKFRVDYRVIPWATYTDPEVARVGLNEQEAREQGIAYEVSRYGVDDLDRAITDSEDHGLVKVLTVPGKDKILGVAIVGNHAGDLIAEFVTAMKYNLGLNKILGTIHIYPTMAEANKYVAGVWKKNHAPQHVLNWLEKFHRWRRGG